MAIEIPDNYILPTAKGAFYTVSSNKSDPTRQFLQRLMSEKESLAINSFSLNNYFINTSDQIEVLYQIQKNGWISGLAEKKQVDTGSIEVIFPEILEKLSNDKKALLADDQGFCIVSTGYDEEDSELLAALSTDFSVVSLLHQNNAMSKLNLQSSALALIDASGHSSVGFWPIYIGDSLFVLVVSGSPCFDQEPFVDLVWSLHQKYMLY